TRSTPRSTLLPYTTLFRSIIIVATREAFKTVPNSIREASYAMGATKLQTIRYQTLPAAFGGIMTGIILALSRAVGETAPLIVIRSEEHTSELQSRENLVCR